MNFLALKPKFDEFHAFLIVLLLQKVVDFFNSLFGKLMEVRDILQNAFCKQFPLILILMGTLFQFEECVRKILAHLIKRFRV